MCVYNPAVTCGVNIYIYNEIWTCPREGNNFNNMKLAGYLISRRMIKSVERTYKTEWNWSHSNDQISHHYLPDKISRLPIIALNHGILDPTHHWKLQNQPQFLAFSLMIQLLVCAGYAPIFAPKSQRILVKIGARTYKHGHLRQTISDWWLTYPSEKCEFVSWDDYSQLNGKMKNMFQTTNQFWGWDHPAYPNNELAAQ